MRVVIVNSGVANVRSVANMLKRLQVPSTISDDPAVVNDADVLILPGVGSYDSAIGRLAACGLIDVLAHKALDEQVPVLGLCLGMQLFATGSEEGTKPGFNWVPGDLKRLPKVDAQGRAIKVPHMGWNLIACAQNDFLYQGMGAEPRFYFDHSYAYTGIAPEHVLGRATHGIEFAAGVMRENIVGVQFHPEKSHRFGLSLFANFVAFAKVQLAHIGRDVVQG